MSYTGYAYIVFLRKRENLLWLGIRKSKKTQNQIRRIGDADSGFLLYAS